MKALAVAGSYLCVALAFCGCARGAESASGAAGSLGKTEPVRLSRSESGYEATLLVQRHPGRLSLMLTPSVPSATPPPASMAARLELFKPLLVQVLQGNNREATYSLTVGEYPELGGRIAAAAICSGEWNTRTGRHRGSNAGVAVRELLERQHLYPEVASFFASLGYTVKAESAEAVVLCRWKEIAHQVGSLTCDARLEGASRVPCGASIVFGLTAME